MNQVLDKAFVGTGCTLQAALRSKRYAQLLSEELRLEDEVCDDPLATAALHAGPVPVTVCLNTKQGERAERAILKLPQVKRDPQRRALFRLLGERIAIAASNRLPLRIRRLAKRWGELEEFEQRALLMALSSFLETSDLDKPKTRDEDLANQPDERVMPAVYRPGRKGLPHPNCLGKAQLLAGFVRLTGAQAYGCTPILQYDQARLAIHIDICQATLEALESMPDYNRRWARKLRKAIKSDKEKLAYPSWQHAGVLIKLVSGKWMIVDPNFRGVQELPDQAKVREALERLSKFERVQPGVAVLDGPRDLRKSCRPHRRRLKRGIEPARFVAEEAMRTPLDLDKVVERIMRSKHFNAIRDGMGIPAAVRRKRGREGSLRWWLQWQIISTQARSKSGMQTTAGALKSVLLDVSDRLLETGIRWFDVSQYIDTGLRLHPQREYQELGHFLATATVAHIAVNANRSSETEEVLVTESACQFRLYHRMLELFNGGNSQGAWDAALALDALPFRLGSVNRLLPKLQARNHTLIRSMTCPEKRKATKVTEAGRRRAKRPRSRTSPPTPVRAEPAPRPSSTRRRR